MNYIASIRLVIATKRNPVVSGREKQNFDC